MRHVIWIFVPLFLAAMVIYWRARSPHPKARSAERLVSVLSGLLALLAAVLAFYLSFIM